MNKKIMIVAVMGMIGSFAYWISRAQPSPTPQSPFPSLTTNPGAMPSSHGAPDTPSSQPVPAQTTPPSYPQATTPPAFYNAAQAPASVMPSAPSSFVPNAPSAPQPSSFPASQSMPMQGAMNLSNPMQQNEPSIIIRTPNELTGLIGKAKDNTSEIAKLIPSQIEYQGNKSKFIGIIEQEKANQEKELEQLQQASSAYNKAHKKKSETASKPFSSTEWSTFKTNIERIHKATLMLDYMQQLEEKIK